MVKKTIKDFEGAVSVNGDITPITREKIEQLDSSKWPEMSVNELTEQRTILMNRIFAAQSYGGNDNIVAQLQRGLNILEGIIQQRGLDSIDEETRLI